MVTVTGDIGRESIVQISTTGESTITDFGNSCRKSQAAEILESQGNKADALEIYQDIKKNYVNSALVQSQEIEKYIERASR